MPIDLASLEKDYNAHSQRYEALLSGVASQLEVLIVKQAKLSLATPITQRVKSWNSIVDKCERKNLEPTSVSAISDIAGIRMVFLFAREEKTARNIITEHFEVISEEDTEDRLSSDQFGYNSVHYQVCPNPDWFKLPVFHDMEDLQLEIQVRTISQHIWAEASHALQYKREDQVPSDVSRPIYRVSALLDLVDLEFERVLEKRDEYTQRLRSEPDVASTGDLNPDVLRKLVEDLLPIEYARDGEDFGELLDDLGAASITSSAEFSELIEQHLPGVNEIVDAQIDERAKLVEEGTLKLNEEDTIDLEKRLIHSRTDLVRIAIMLAADSSGDKES